MSLLSDPLDTRIIKDAPLPFQKSLTYQKLFTGKLIDLKLLMHFFQNQGVLDQNMVQKILLQSQQIFKMQSNLIFVNDPVSVIGDIHGQFYDMATIIKNNNFLETKRKYLFLGDYVDRGLFSLQVLIFILAMKINSPKRVILLRGNHQSRQLTTYFNFRNQCLQSYNQEIYNKFIDLFNTLPIAAIVNRKFLCMHGGISTLFESVYRKKYRFCQIPTSGLFCDLLWADPINHPQGKMKELTSYNQLRGCSVNFGHTLTKKILQITKMSCIIRAHQAKKEGYQMHKWSGLQKFPPIITVFSAPNYCDFYNNKGAYIFIENNILQIRQIQKANHPFFLPNNLTLFDWTIPFISEKITQMFHYLLKLDFQAKDQIQIQLIDKRKIIQELLKLQQEDAEQKMEIIKYNGKVMGQQLMQIQKAREYVLKIYNKNFNYEKQIDKVNQKRPESIENGIETIYNYKRKQY